MNQFLLFSFIGFGLGFIGFPVLLGIFVLFRNTLERRKIKRMLKKNRFLVTIDPKDYDVKAWEGKKYGNIDISKTKADLENLSNQIFKKSKESSDDTFIMKSIDYVKEARRNKYSDEWIKEEFKKKSYTDELINQIFENI